MDALTGNASRKHARQDTSNGSVDTSDKRKLDREYKKEVQRELRFNLMAGIEAILLRDQLKQEMKAARRLAAEEAKKDKGGGRKAKKKSREPETRRGITGRTSNYGSLASSNVFRDSNASLSKRALPQVGEYRSLGPPLAAHV